MQLCKLLLASGENRVGVIEADHVRYLNLSKIPGLHDLSDVLHADQPSELAHDLIDEKSPRLALEEVDLLAPIDRQEVWAAGVTYRRSQEARERESAGAARFYDLVYTAPRPELFFKAPAYRVSGPGDRVRIRRDSQWNVPEPELALVLSPRLKMVGYTIGNDMSSRDIEGENPLYLPQAKMYDHSCALGPAITLADSMPAADQVRIHLEIERGGKSVFDGSTTQSAMKRSLEELISWLGREITFPHGAILLTGTGVVPGDDFTLAVGDEVHIDITGIGRLTNFVDQKE
jgi:2-dehydro-3-deoxy-D-arabinonate dehydratase